MTIKELKTKEELIEWVNNWEMTWEGLSKDSFEQALEMCSKDGKDGEIHVITGKTMNELCKLTGDNAYPEDLTIASIKNYKGLAVHYGARWSWDIYANNAYREHNNPLKIKGI